MDSNSHLESVAKSYDKSIGLGKGALACLTY